MENDANFHLGNFPLPLKLEHLESSRTNSNGGKKNFENFNAEAKVIKKVSS
jgi:hypothetical protein